MTQETQSLITDEMRASVGVESEPTILEVDKTGIRMFARAVQQTDQIYYDEEYAKSKGYRSLVAYSSSLRGSRPQPMPKDTRTMQRRESSSAFA